MHQVQKVIDDYLKALDQVYGRAYREQTQVEHRGGTSIVLQLPGKAKQLIDIGDLRNMTNYLRQQAKQKQAA